MKRVVLVVALLQWLLCIGDASAQSVDAASASKASVTMKYKITAQLKTSLVVLDVLLPRSIPGRQQIVAIDYSVKPTEIYEKNGQSYAQFRIDQPSSNMEIAINVTAETYRYDFVTASSNPKGRQMEKEETLKQWLVHELYLEKYSPLIQSAAKELQGKDEEETLRNCFNFVVKTLSKRPYDDKDYGAVWALQQKKGDCTEYADLFIALCRANGIPARFCQGYLLEAVPDTAKHDWAEVYTKQYGWVPFDPFYTYLGKATTFSEMRPIYLFLDGERRNSVLQNHHYWAYRYEGNGAGIRDAFVVNKRETK